MATAAFKSSTKRSPVVPSAATSSSNLRRSRSLSRYSGVVSTESGRFVDTVKKLGYPEISLDDLAGEFFQGKKENYKDDEDVSPWVERDMSRWRGRSVSRQRKGILENNGGSEGNFSGRLRRQRSVSVARSRYSDSESHSSALTDDEARDACVSRSVTEKTIRAVYAQRKREHPSGDGEGTGLYEVMRKEVKHAVEEIRTELEKFMVKMEPKAIVNGDDSLTNHSKVIQAIAQIRRNYTTELEQSEKRRQGLLAELAVEEQRRQELTKIVKELLLAPKQTSLPERPSRCRMSSNNRTKISRYLTEEAEKYFEDFLSNVEDADISSYDGERSDTSSTLGGSTKLRDSIIHSTIEETHGSLMKAASLAIETDGVVLPWLQWETNAGSPSPCKTKTGVTVDSRNNLFDAPQEATPACDSSNLSTSSGRSWSPEGSGCCSAASRDIKRSMFGAEDLPNGSSVDRSKGSPFDMDEYVHLQYNEDRLFERFRQRQRIDSGSLIICGRTSM